MSYLRQHGTRAPVPQSEPLREDQVENSAGGYAWAVDKWARLRRFLVLGSEGGSYYASERDLTRENVGALKACLADDGVRTVAEIVMVSEGGRSPKNDQAIFALAAAVALGDDATKQAALASLPRVCRIGTHLFMFADFLDRSFGKATGRAKRRAFGRWYADRPLDDAAFQMVKYRQRGGWSHRDLLRLAHPAGKVSAGNPTVSVSDEHATLFAWAAGRDVDRAQLPRIVQGFLAAQETDSDDEWVRLIGEYRLPREALPTDALNSRKVWDAMLQAGMPLTAMIRNLGTMSKLGVLTPTSDGTLKVLDTLANGDAIRKARVHPFSVLLAMNTYASGHGFRGSATWSPVPKIVDALDGAFYAAFGNVEATNKRWLFGLDVSGSMDGSYLFGTGLSAREGASAMALVTAAVEPLYEAVAFTGGGWYSRGSEADHVTPFPLSARERLDDVVARTRSLDFGRTDCALPMLYATKYAREVDVFAIFTDSETWAGSIHPTQALQEYRRQSGIDAKLIVVAMTSNGFTIADPNDAGMLDVVGFDSATPNVMAEFAAGRL